LILAAHAGEQPETKPFKPLIFKDDKMNTVVGLLLVSLGGLIMGGGSWPIKIMKRFQFEHWWFIGMLLGLLVIPWTITLAFCPDAMDAFNSVDTTVLIKSNLFSLCWGIANVLGGMCLVRIGISLSVAILTGVGVVLGVTIPMAVKGSGLFGGAADLTSAAGIVVLAGAAVMLMGIIMAALAGFGREKIRPAGQRKNGGFLTGLILCLMAGVLSCGISFAFVYSQGPIVEAMEIRGAGTIAANISVWAFALMGGGLVNILYPAFLLTRNKSWNVFAGNIKEIGLSVVMGLNFIIAIVLMGKGMLCLGSMGASVGFGVQQVMQMLGGQIIGFVSGEWKEVHGRSRMRMYIAILMLLTAAVIMAFGNTLSLQSIG